jgi:uncharacterized protein Usg
VEDRNPDLFFFLPDDEILLQRKILCAQDLAEQIKEMKAAEKRWESQASSPDFKLSHKKLKKKKKQQHFFTAKIDSSCRLGAFCCLSIAFVKKTVELSLVLFVCCCGDSHDLDLMILQSP